MDSLVLVGIENCGVLSPTRLPSTWGWHVPSACPPTSVNYSRVFHGGFDCILNDVLHGFDPILCAEFCCFGCGFSCNVLHIILQCFEMIFEMVFQKGFGKEMHKICKGFWKMIFEVLRDREAEASG